MAIKMKNVILFSPNGYVGSFIKKRIETDSDIRLFEMTRESDWCQYKDVYDVMIYSAAVTSGRHATAEKYVQDNVVTAVSVINFCKENKIKRVIYLSSDEIYGELNTDMVSEKAVMVNPNLYAATKYLAEKIIIESRIPYYILRLPGVVGGTWGNNFIYNLMRRIKNSENIELYNINRKFNNILHIDDLTEFMHTLCKLDNSNRSEIFLLGNTENVELQEIVVYIMHLYHSKSQLYSIETDSKRYFTLDTAKAEEYGYTSKKILTIIDELYHMQESG